MRRFLMTLAAVLLVNSSAYAADDDNKRSQGEHRGPPPVALEACEFSVQGDPCSFEGRRGDTLEGTCEAPDDRPLACRPDGHRMPGKQADE